MIRHASGLLLGTMLATAAFAQVAPFDMSPERAAEPAPPGVTIDTQPQPPAAVQPSQPKAPTATVPATPVPAAPVQPAADQPGTTAEADDLNVAATASQTEAATTVDARRYLIPSRELILEGETQRRSWSVFLSAEEASAARQMHVGYQNAIVVAPELSTFKILVNNVSLFDLPIQSSESISDLAAKYPSRTSESRRQYGFDRSRHAASN
jgi:hypothetical protein